MDLKKKIRTVVDFPVKGIRFRDITSLLQDPVAFKESIDQLAKIGYPYNVDAIVGVEARGFIIGASLAYAMGVGFIPVRKPGKLPGETISKSYGLEYGEDSIEIHRDAIEPGGKVLLVDDLLATGGTAQATADLLKKMGAKVAACLFLIELTDLKGRERLKKYKVHSLVEFTEDER